LKIATARVIVVPVCDGRVCQIAKQATNIWIATHEKSRIAALQLQSQICELKEALSDNQTANENLEKDLRASERRVKINKTKSSGGIPPNFDISLEESYGNADDHMDYDNKHPHKKCISMVCAKCGMDSVSNPSLHFHSVPIYPAESWAKVA
jgi:hypothetical protein